MPHTVHRTLSEVALLTHASCGTCSGSRSSFRIPRRGRAPAGRGRAPRERCPAREARGA